MNLEQVYAEASERLGIDKSIIKKSYKLFWKFIRDKIEELPLKEELTEEEFGKLRTNFNIPSVGKLYCTYKEFSGAHKKHEFIEKYKRKNEYKRNKATVHEDCDYNGQI